MSTAPRPTPRIAIAGFQHETNSFSSIPATLRDFEIADSWPGLLRGEAVLTGTQGLNLPIAGFVDAASAQGLDLHPILWCAAEPSGPVTREAFDTITGEITRDLAANGPFDAVYLDLHGAMIAEDHIDGEGEVLRRVRDVVGPNTPIAISLDLHANLASDITQLADIICIFRTYPHLDMAATGARCVGRLLAALAGETRVSILRHAPFLIPMHAQWTGADPMRGLYLLAEDLDVELAAGFTAADAPFAGPVVLAQAATQDMANQKAHALLTAICAAEDGFEGTPPDPNTAVAQALQFPAGKPVVVADVEDNPGGGGASDTTGLLRAMVDQRATGAMLGVLHDPDAAQAAHTAGVGADLQLSLGGRSGGADNRPLETHVRVKALSDGRVVYEGQMYGGGIADMGPSACLHITTGGADVHVVVSSIRNQCLDRGYFRHFGLEPEAATLIGVKSTVHFRADFDPIAQATLITRVPGVLHSDLSQAPYRNLRPGIRLGPNGPAYSG